MVTDFDPGDDRLDFSGFFRDLSVQDVFAAASQQGSDVILTFGTHTLTLRDFTIGQLDADDTLV